MPTLLAVNSTDEQPAGHAPELRLAAALLVRAAAARASAVVWRRAAASRQGKHGQPTDYDQMALAIGLARMAGGIAAAADGARATTLDKEAARLTAAYALLDEVRLIHGKALLELVKYQENWK